MANTKGQCILPTELFFNVLYYSDPRDVIRWRTVSKWFYAIAHDPTVWKILYANAPFIRPPGPFPSQSTASLERSLVQSARLAQSWTTQPLQYVSSVETLFDGMFTDFAGDWGMVIIGGRWFIGCHSRRQFVVRDIDPKAKTRATRVLWEQEEEIACWDICSVTSAEGLGVVYVLLGDRRFRWRLLELQIDSVSGALRDLVVLDLPECGSVTWSSARINSGLSPLLSALPLQLAFDTRTRLFYRFPKFGIASEEIRRRINSSPMDMCGKMVKPTNTHVFVFTSYQHGQDRKYMTLIQAFAVPHGCPSAKDGQDILRLSHEGLLFFRGPFSVIRNSTVDPITGFIGLRFLCKNWMYGAVYCVDVTLREPPVAVGVTPLIASWHTVTTKGSVPFTLDWLPSSNDGHTRGLRIEYDRGNVAKFTIDATQPCCAATLGQCTPLPEILKHRHCRYFDTVRGRLCFIRFAAEGLCWSLVVIDILDGST